MQIDLKQCFTKNVSYNFVPIVLRNLLFIFNRQAIRTVVSDFDYGTFFRVDFSQFGKSYSHVYINTIRGGEKMRQSFEIFKK